MSVILVGIALAATKITPPAKPAAPSTLESRIVEAHNVERRRVGTKPLLWSARLAADAKIWADHLARTNNFEHAPEKAGAAPQGENLWMGTVHSYSPEDMVGGWIEEKAQFKLGLFPKVSTSGDWQDVGHYTQLIWHNTTEVGCALAANRNDEFLVCRYSPAGNWMGQSPVGPLSAEKRPKR